MNIGILSPFEEKPTGIVKATNALHDFIFKIDKTNKYYAIGGSTLWNPRFNNARAIDVPLYGEIAYTVMAYDFDIVHGHRVPYKVPKAYKGAKLFTIYDIRPYSHPEWDKDNAVREFANEVKDCAQESDCIITISNYSKQEIVEYYGIPENKVEVTYLGLYPVEKFEKDGIKPHALINKLNEYFLAVSGLDLNKNQVGIIKAYILFRERYPDMDIALVITGKDRNTTEIEKLKQTAEYMKWSDSIIFTGYVSDEEVVWLYKNTSLFLYPSFFEGFGLPVLEAMSVGKPVVTSDVTSLPEVGGDAVEYCNPYEIESIEQAIENIVFDEKHRSDLENRAIDQASLFSYSKAAERMIEIYKRYSP